MPLEVETTRVTNLTEDVKPLNRSKVQIDGKEHLSAHTQSAIQIAIWRITLDSIKEDNQKNPQTDQFSRHQPKIEELSNARIQSRNTQLPPLF